MVQYGSFGGSHVATRSDSLIAVVVDRIPPDLGLQCRMGILSERWPGHGFAGGDHSGFNEPRSANDLVGYF